MAGPAPGRPPGRSCGSQVHVDSTGSGAGLGGGMQDLRAEVTSGLLQFPKVTTEALGKHGRVLESLLCGKLAAGNKGLAFLTCGPELEVVSSVTGECLSAYKFSGVNEEPPTVLAVKEFSWQKRTGLLIGLGDAEGSVLCLYDLGRSRVVKALVLPGKVTAIEPISNHGGASPSSQRLHPSLRWLFGVATVGTNVGQILLIDLCLDDLSYSQNEVEASDLEVMAGFPADVPRIRESAAGEGRHLCFPLVSPSGRAVSTLSYINRTNQLVAGFSDGCLELWNMGSMKREYCAQLEGGRAPVHAVTFQEPEDDPRNCCYLWAFQSAQDREENVLSLHLLQLVFGDRQCLASGQALYERFEYCEERYTLDLIGGMFPLRGPTRNPKLLGCQSIEKFPSRDDREEGTREALSPDTSVSIFTWQVTMYGQGKPSIYLGIFDINSWYHAQMPDSLRSGEYLNNCSYFALWSLDSVASRTSHSILDILVHERSLSRGICPSYSPPEEFLNPSSYNFDATCLLNSGVVHVSCTGIQKKTLNFLKESAPFLSEVVSEGYNQCLVAGLLSPVHTGLQPSSLSQEEKLKAVFSAAIRTSSLGVLTGCVRRWVTEEQPNSAANLCFVLEWTWTQVILTKEEFDRLCTPLFDGSCRFIGPQTAQSIQQCHLRLRNLSTALRCFAKVAKGHVNLTTKCMVSQLIDQYEQVVVWFFHSGLLPEGLGDAVQVSKLCYNYPAIHSYYVGRRQQCKLLSRGKWNPDCLMIDGMVSQLGDRVEKLWKRDEGGTGKYPPPSLHALLDIYLLDNITEERKHFITIYLLLDMIYSFPKKRNVSIESFRMAFAISWNQVKLIQGFWLIDHNDYEKGLDLLFHPATAKPEPWQHSKVIGAFLSQGEPRRALRYIQTMKPAVTSESDITLHLTVLLSNRCMMEAWSVLRQHSDGADREGLLKHTYSVCQEMGLVEDLLRFPLTDTEQEGLVRFLQSSTSAQSREFLLVHHLQRASYIPALKLNQTLKMSVVNDRDPHLRERSAVRNAMLDEYGKVLPRVHRRLAIERASPAHVSTCIQSGTQPKPLSAVLKPAVGGNVLARSTFIHNVLPIIGEIWKSDEPKTSTLGYKSPWDSVVGPGPQPSLSLGFIQQPPTGFPWNLTSSSLPASSQLTGSHRNNSRASEFHLLETPAIIKKAKTSAMSVTSSGFFELTPHSTPSSGLGSIPSAPPSQPPDRPVTRPLRSQESRTSFVEEGVTMKCITGAADGGRTKVLTPIPSRKCALSGETQRLKNEYPTSPLSSCEVDHEEVEVRSQNTPSQCWEKLDKSKGNSSVSSDSLEYYDAPSPGGFECKFMASKPGSSSTELIPNLSEETEKDSDKDVFESDVAPGDLEKQMAVADVLDDSGSSGLIVSASSVMSEHSLDQEITMSFKDDHEIEVVLKESTDLAEENPPIPDSQEFHRPLRSSRLRKPPTTDTTSRKEVKTPKRMKNSLENQESVERGPGVRNKRLRLTEVETSEVAGHDLDRKARGQRRPVHRSKRGGKRDLRAVGLREDAQRDASRVTLQAKADVPATPRKRGRPRKTCASEDVGSEAAKEERSPKRRKALSTQKRSTRNTPAARKNRGVGKRTLEKSGLVPNEELVTVMSSKRKTERVEYHSQKRSVRSVSEKYTEEEKVTKEPRDREEKLPAKTALPPFPYSTRTRSHKTILLPDFSKPVNQPLFSPPESKGSRKEKAKKIDAPDQLKESASDLPSARAVSPPALRTRRKSVCRAPRRVREQDDGAVGQQKGKRIRTEKWKQASKIAEKESSWSPPPVEIKLISPLAAPTDRVKSGPGKTGEVTGRPLRGNRKKASSFPKQIVRRKML